MASLRISEIIGRLAPNSTDGRSARSMSFLIVAILRQMHNSTLLSYCLPKFCKFGIMPKSRLLVRPSRRNANSIIPNEILLTDPVLIPSENHC